MKKLFLITVALLFAALSVQAAQAGRELIKKAQVFEKNKNWSVAGDLYLQAFKSFKKSGDKWYAARKAAYVMLNQKKNAEAQKFLLSIANDKSFSIQDRAAAFHYCCRTTADRKEKLAFLDSCLAMTCGTAHESSCRLIRAAELVALEKFAEAEKCYNTILARPEVAPVIRQNAIMGLAQLAAAKKQYAAAHKYFNEIRKLAKANPRLNPLTAIRNQAACYLFEKKYDEAVACYREVISNPKFPVNIRSKVVEEGLRVYFITFHDPVAARKFYESCKKYNLPPHRYTRVMLRDIAALLDEE